MFYSVPMLESMTLISSHPLSRSRGGSPAKTAAVVIGEHVWLAANVTILKGVHIGARSVIAAGSVVTSDIPEDCLAGGIPAKVIRKITENDLYNHPNSKLDNPN